MLLVIVKNAEGKICGQAPYSGGALTIGRDPARNIVLESKAVSRHHGSLLSSGGKVLYVDEGSSNGSRVDGQPVTAPVQLNGKSVIQIGEYLITLQMMKPDGEPDPKRPVSVPASTPVAAPVVSTKAADADDAFDVQPMMATQPPKPPVPMPASLEGFRITLDDAPKSKAKPEAPQLAAVVGSLLDQQIKGIRSQREDYQETLRVRREQFEQAWREAVVAARELKARVGGDARVLYYVVSRDESEVTVKLKENSSRGFCNLTISRRHPLKETTAEGVVWFAETGDDARAYSNPKDLIEDFVRAIAAKLA